ncbi:MAG TPA: FAD-binding protein [Gemmatimonadaceae bacterium]
MSTERAVSAIRDSSARRSALRISGRGTWLDAGRPVRANETLSLSEDRGVVSYVPGDLTLTVRAGTTLAEIAEITSEHDQWLPLDPYGSTDGTIGATISTASAGPLASSFGLPRDLLLGLEFVNGRGETIRAGGKVVKNVAGFDLCRLLTGSWGTLGVITEVTLRLYARPAVDRTFAIDLDGREGQVTSIVRAIVSSPLSPFALLLLSASAARSAGIGENPVCLIRFGGNDAMVRAQVSGLAQLARPEEVDTKIWLTVRLLDIDAHSTVRISSLPQRVIGHGARMLRDDIPAIRTCIDPRRGVVRVMVGSSPEEIDPGALRTDLDFGRGDGAPSSEVIFEKLPLDIWSIASPTVVSDALSKGIKNAYDPLDILNPGILGD